MIACARGRRKAKIQTSFDCSRSHVFWEAPIPLICWFWADPGKRMQSMAVQNDKSARTCPTSLVAGYCSHNVLLSAKLGEGATVFI